MRLIRFALAAVLVLTTFASLHAQTKRAPMLVVFKDGFVTRGLVKRDTTYFTDPASGSSFTIPVPGGYYRVEDGARKLIFPPRQVENVLDGDDEQWAKLVRFAKLVPRAATGQNLPTHWEIDSVGAWDKRWERNFHIKSGGQVYNIRQRVEYLITPNIMSVHALKYDWISYYLTSELSPDVVSALLHSYQDHAKDDPIEERLQVARFLLQANWLDRADQELARLVADHPMTRDKVQPMREGIKAIRARQFVDEIGQLHKVGQHAEVQRRLEAIDKPEIAPFVGQKDLIQVQELKNKYTDANEKLEPARRFLKELPALVPEFRRGLYAEAASAILADLNYDTLPRVLTFVGQAQERQRSAKEGKPSLAVEEALSFAITGWLLGDGAAEKNPDTARAAWDARKLVLNYLKSDDALKRKAMVEAHIKGKGLGVDLVARMLSYLPPAQPYPKPDGKPIELQVERGDAQEATYHVQLPPEYHHQRAYPVLIVLHHSGEKPAEALAGWGELARREGYIVVAPVWGKGVRPVFQNTAREQAIVIECLRDLRHRFQVDSDRVFLFGCEEGGSLAYEVGLSHPDQFAGVIPMSAAPSSVGQSYWPNGQYLPFYVVNGDRTGKLAKDNSTLFAKWLRWDYPSFYIEYKGRQAEFFKGEPKLIFEWMNRKKRLNPLRELGRKGEELKTMRAGDNRFYWLSTSDIQPRYLLRGKPSNNTPVASMRGKIFSGNMVHVYTQGLKQVTIWFGPGMLEYGQNATIKVDSHLVGGLKNQVTPNLGTLLEHLSDQGDRQRLYWARVDVKNL